MSRKHRAYSRITRTLSRMKSATTVVDGVMMPYLYAGRGEPLVLLHGFADQKETWSLVGPVLARGYRVIAPDLPGYGDAGEIAPGEASLERQAGFLRGFLDGIGVGEAHFCGNSMGGGVVMTFAMRHPERVRSMSLLSSMGPLVRDSTLKRLVDAGHNPLLPKTMQEYEEMLDFIFERRPPLPSPIRRHLARRHIARRSRYEAQFEMLREEADIDYGQLKHPALILHGHRDRLIDPSTGHALAERLGNARLLMIDKVGHAPQWEAPRKTIAAMRDFLQTAR